LMEQVHERVHVLESFVKGSWVGRKLPCLAE
jgi:hypothetical protein